MRLSVRSVLCCVFCAPLCFFANAQAAGPDIVLGASMAHTPALAARTQAIERGSRLYFDKINAAGGIGGRKIKLVVYDNQNEGKLIVENATTLIEKDKVTALFEVYGSLATQILRPLLEKENILLLAPISGQSLRGPTAQNIFSVRPGFEIEATTLVDFLVQKRGVNKFGIFNSQDGPAESGSSGRAATYLALQKQHLDFVSAASLPADNMKLDQVVNAFQQAGADAIFLWTRDEQAIELIKLAHAKGYRPIFACGSFLGTSTFIEGVSKIGKGDSDVLLSQSVPTPQATENLLGADFFADAKAAKMPLENLTSGEIEGYYNAVFVADVLKRAGKDLSTAHLRDVLEKLKNADIDGIKISFSADDHMGVKSAFLTQLKAGRLANLPAKP